MANMKEIRKASGMTQVAFAKALGVSSVTVAKYEQGKVNPSAKVKARIQELFGMEVTFEAAPAEAPAEAPVAKKKPAARKKAEKQAEPEIEAVATEPAAVEAESAPVAEAAPATAEPMVIIQSPMGGEITAQEILARVGEADRIYVRVDQNRAYWVRGEETGEVELWG